MDPQRPPPKSKPKAELSPAGRALRLLARREHTRRELEVKLGPHVADPDELHALLDDFTARGWLSESRAVAQLVNSKRDRMGAARIRHALRQRGAPEDLIASAVQGLRDTELDRARAVWGRKFSSPPTDAAERARQVRFLQARGFSVEVALRVVRGKGHDSGE